MSRSLRIQHPDAWYHVMNRGGCGKRFLQKEDYWSFVDLLEELDEVFNVKIASYGLMSNHLLVQTPDADLPRSMRHLNGGPVAGVEAVGKIPETRSGASWRSGYAVRYGRKQEE